MTDRPAWDDMALVGRVARVHGLHGQVIVNPDTDFVEDRFEPGRLVYVRRDDGVSCLRVASLRIQRGRPIVAFEGVESIEQAETLAGLELRVPLDWLARLPEHSYYQHDLVGCRVEADGQPVGTVSSVEGDGGAARLVVETSQGEVLVPLAADICRSIDVERRVIVIAPPDGLMELNRPTGLPRRKDRRRTQRARG